MGRILAAAAAVALVAAAFAATAGAAPLVVTAPRERQYPHAVPARLRRCDRGQCPGRELQLSQHRDRALAGGQPHQPERRGGVLAAGPLVGRRLARPGGGGQPRRRRQLRLLRAALQQLRRRHRGQRRRLRALIGPVGVVGAQRRPVVDQPVGRHDDHTQRGPGRQDAPRLGDLERAVHAEVRHLADRLPHRQQLQRQGIAHRRPHRPERQPGLRGVGPLRLAERERSADAL